MAKKLKTGRKKVEASEKVILVGFYTKKKFVDNVGGMEQAREMAKNYLETAYAYSINA